jgi:hypothetical protein
MKTILEFDPQFERSRETMLPYASEIYDLPKPAQSTNSAVPGHLCLFKRHETFGQMAPVVSDSGGSCSMGSHEKILCQVHLALPIKLSGLTMADLKLTSWKAL